MKLGRSDTSYGYILIRDRHVKFCFIETGGWCRSCCAPVRVLCCSLPLVYRRVPHTSPPPAHTPDVPIHTRYTIGVAFRIDVRALNAALVPSSIKIYVTSPCLLVLGLLTSSDLLCLTLRVAAPHEPTIRSRSDSIRSGIGSPRRLRASKRAYLRARVQAE